MRSYWQFQGRFWSSHGFLEDDVFDSKIVGVKSKGEWNSLILFLM